MKKLYFLILSLVLNDLSAQMPEGFNYQAVIRDSEGIIIADQQVGVRISILAESSTGSSVFSETFTETTNSFGMVNLIIGSDPASISSVDWASAPYFLKVEIDIQGGTNYIEMGTSQIMSVPYAVHAKKAEYVRDFDLAHVLAGGNDAGNRRITNLADPVDDQDPITKSYFDNIIVEIAELSKLFDLGFTAEQFYNTDYLVGAMEEAGFNESELTSAGFIGTVTDYDDNTYNWVKIGNQIWMAENLKVTHYNNGDEIPLVTNNTDWTNLSSGAYCWYNNDIRYSTSYGALYNWYVVSDSRNVCPTNWHVPSASEMKALENFLGGYLVAGETLKETGTVHWSNTNSNVTNESRFTGLPSGFRTNTGIFQEIQQSGYHWTSTEHETGGGNANAWKTYDAPLNIFESIPAAFGRGHAIRCIGD